MAITHEFDPGPVNEPFLTLARQYPGTDVYPASGFRVEWGPIFHRGRLDGSARLLVIGQDPAQAESIARRILVGEAGHRAQGLMGKLGITRSYVLVNTYVYSVFGQGAGEANATNKDIAAYRHKWLDAIFAANQIDAVLALGHLADQAWQTWKKTATGKTFSPAYQHVTHPTQPESSSGGDRTKLRAAIKAMLANWNQALEQLHPLPHPDQPAPLVPYGTSFKTGERVEIPEGDLPAGIPDWMRSPHAWAKRVGTTANAKRRNITVTIPAGIVT
jgi:hypothetical protein